MVKYITVNDTKKNNKKRLQLYLYKEKNIYTKVWRKETERYKRERRVIQYKKKEMKEERE